MKKRKRKMRTSSRMCGPVVVWSSLIFCATILVVVANTEAQANQQVYNNRSATPTTPTFDEEFHLLNISAAAAAAAQELPRLERQIQTNQTSYLSAADRNETASLIANSVDNNEDLLAIETTKLLTIGRRQQQEVVSSSNSTQLAAPYENNANLTTLNESLPNVVGGERNRTDSEHLRETLPPPPVPNQRQFIKLFQAQQSRLPQPQSQQPPLTLIPVQVRHYSTLNFQSQTHRLPNWPGDSSANTYFPGVASSGFESNRSRSSSGGKPVITTVAPLTWSTYSQFANGSGTNNHQNIQTTEHNNNNSQSISGSRHNESEFELFSGENEKKSNHKNNFTDNQEDIQNGANRKHKTFPSLLSSEAQNGEDEFEQSLMGGQFNQPARNNSINNNSTTSIHGGKQLQLNWNQLLRQATESNVMESLMVTNRSMVSLLCDTNDMLVRLKFKQPFRGIVMTNLDKLRSCKLIGNGTRYYEMRISLRDCGTRQEMPRLFINNIQIQFRDHNQSPSHLSTIADVVDDEIKTIICSYPLRPRAPPPPELPPGSTLPERIIELANGGTGFGAGGAPDQVNAAKLVYYEPLFLISGLLLFAMVLLGLTTGAYLFTKQQQRRRRQQEQIGIRSNGFTSSRLYRNPPAQTANNMAGSFGNNNNFFLPPSLSGSTKGKTISSNSNRKYGNSSLKTSKYVDTKSRTHTNQPRGRVSSTLPRSKSQIIPLPAPTIGKKITESYNWPIIKNHSAADSLKSVTTIEIPFVGSKTVAINQPYSEKSAPEMIKPKVPIKPKRLQTIQQQQQKFPVETKKTADHLQKQANTLRKVKEKERSREELRDNDDVDVDVHKRQQQQTELRFGSLRKTLTSPQEYKRLQEIVRMFDDIVIESHVDKGSKGTIVIYNTRLNPSKYKTKIMDEISDRERKKLGELLRTDEVFRSLVVESTNKETFRRKLKNNPAYSGKFSKNTWNLFEEILLDPDIVSDATATSDANESNSISQDESSSSSPLSKSPPPPSPSPPPPPPPPSPKSVEEVAKIVNSQEDKESILRALDSNLPPESLSDQRDSLNSSSLSTPSPPKLAAPAQTLKTITASSSLTSELAELRQTHQVEKRTTQNKLDDHLSNTESVSTSIRVSQFNSTRVARGDGGLAGTLINIDSVTNFTSSEDFSTYTRSSIEHRQFDERDPPADTVLDSLPYVDELNHQTISADAAMSNTNNNNNQNYNYNTRPLPIKKQPHRTTKSSLNKRADTPIAFRSRSPSQRS